MYIHVNVYMSSYVHSDSVLVCLPTLTGSIFAFFSLVLGDDFTKVCKTI